MLVEFSIMLIAYMLYLCCSYFCAYFSMYEYYWQYWLTCEAHFFLPEAERAFLPIQFQKAIFWSMLEKPPSLSAVIPLYSLMLNHVIFWHECKHFFKFDTRSTKYYTVQHTHQICTMQTSYPTRLRSPTCSSAFLQGKIHDSYFSC